MAVVPTLGLYLHDRFGLEGASLQTWTGVVYAAAPLTAAVMGPIWGLVGDRWGRKAMVIRAGVAISVATALMPMAPGPVWLMALRILQGAFAGFVAPAMALGTADVPIDRQGQTIGRLQLGLALGLLVGPSIGGEIAFHFGRTSVFYLASAVSLVSVVPVLLLARESHARPTEAGLPTSFRQELTGLLGNRVFLALLFCIFLMRFGLQMVEPYVALFIRDFGPHPLVRAMVDDQELALERTIAVAFGALAVAQLLFTPRWGRLSDRIGPMRCMATIGIGLALVFFATGLTTSIEGFLPLRCAAAVMMSGGMTLAYTAVARRVAPERKNLAFSLAQSGMQFGLSLGPVLGDLMTGGAGMAALYFTGGICLLSSGIGMILVRRASLPRNGSATDPPADDPS